MSVNLAKHCFTVSEYERMGETGVFAPDARVELIAGEIIEMSPIESRHAACVELISDRFREQSQGKLGVRTQNPIVLDDFSEPEPDVTVVRFREDYYRQAHPRPQDVFIVVEVAEATLHLDRNTKKSLYARAGIAEFLIINLVEDVIEYCLSPVAGSYQDNQLLRRGDTYTSSTIPGLTLDIETVLS